MKDILDYMIEKSGKKVRIVVKDEYVRKNDILDSYGDDPMLVKNAGWNCRVGVYEAIDKILGFNG